MAEETLTVGTTGDYEPVTWRDPTTGNYVGDDIDLMQAFAANAGHDLSFVQTTWATMLDDLTAGRFRMAVGGITRTDGRARRALVSDPVATTGKVAPVRCGEEDRYASLAAIDQTSTRIVENRGGTNQPFALAETSHAVVILVPDNAMAFDYLENDKADVMFTDSIEAVYHQKQREGLCAVHPERPYTRAQRVFLFRKDEGPLRDAFNRWLAIRKATGAAAQ